MKSFDEWIVRQVINISDDPEIMIDRIKVLCLSSWQAAQEAQRDSDADMIIDEFSFIEEYDTSDGFILAEQIRNNKAV